MGLDVVEVVMRTEEVFGINVPNEDAEQATTVGRLYEIVCVRLGLPPTRPTRPGTPRLTNAPSIPGRFITPPTATPSWTNEDIWATLVATVVDQLRVDASEVTYHAHWSDDLGAD